MHTVTLDPPAAVLAERQRLGLDRFDEVWDGEYHMVPTPSVEHQRMARRLVVALDPIVEVEGLELLYEINLLVSEEIGFRDFRVPDLIVFPEDRAGIAGIIGAASLAVEIRSPGDESFKKLPFYEQLGVGEVLIIDRDTKAVRHWINGDDGLVESPGEPAGHHRLGCVPVSLHTDDGALVVTTDDATIRI